MGYMPKVAKMLGVEVEQVFKIKSVLAEEPDDAFYKFTETAFCIYDSETGVWESSLRYTDIFDGEAFIIEIPFEPKKGEKYWYVYWNKNEIDTSYTLWDDSVLCWLDKYAGNCFRTVAEAGAHKYEIYQKLTGRKWEEK